MAVTTVAGVKLGNTGGCDTVAISVKLGNSGGCDTVAISVKLGNSGGCNTGVFDTAVTGGKPELPNSLRLASVFSAIRQYRCLLWNPKFRVLIHKKPRHRCVTKPEAAV